MENNSFDEIISLGNNCSIATTLRNLKQRNLAYPFDWNITHLSFLIYIFSNKFKNLDIIFNDCDKFKKKCNETKIKYKDMIFFYHDNDNIQKLKDKFTKRFNRLDTLLNSNKNILFVRHSKTDTIENLIELKDIIRKNYPMLKFKILLINNIKETIVNEFIIHYYLDSKCFLHKIRENNYHYVDTKLTHKTMLKILSTFKSPKYEQPSNRDSDI
jgi:hypothetical protein